MSTGINQLNENGVLKYLDSHMVLQVVDFYLSNDQAAKDNLLRYKKDVLFKTLLSDLQDKFIQENQGILTETEKESNLQIRQHTQKLEEELKNHIKGFLNLTENFKKNNNFDMSSSIHRKIIDETSINKLLEYSNVLYQTGKYEEAKEILTDFLKVNHDNKKNLSKIILAMWKILSINIMMKNWNEAAQNFLEIQKVVQSLKLNLDEEFRKINSDSADKVRVDFRDILLHRGYLIHWSLFSLKNSKGGMETFLQLVFNGEIYNLIETSFNYMFKYLIIFSIISKSKMNIQTLKSTIQNVSGNDIFINLFYSMFNDFDVEKSFGLVLECAEMMRKEFFLCDYAELFITKSKEVLLENYIQLNSQVDLNSFGKIFGENVESVRKSLEELINVNYGEIKILEKNGVLEFDHSDNEVDRNHFIKINELFDVTKNMVEMVRLNKFNK